MGNRTGTGVWIMAERSDALVIFGVTGDLAYKEIFPALASMIQHGQLDVPVIGIAKAGWNRDQLIVRAWASLEEHGSFDPAAFDKLVSQLRYVDGDYRDAATFSQLKKELGSCVRPLHYLAIPPSLFATVAEGLAGADSAAGARILVGKPFGGGVASGRGV